MRMFVTVGWYVLLYFGLLTHYIQRTIFHCSKYTFCGYSLNNPFMKGMRIYLYERIWLGMKIGNSLNEKHVKSMRKTSSIECIMWCKFEYEYFSKLGWVQKIGIIFLHTCYYSNESIWILSIHKKGTVVVLYQKFNLTFYYLMSWILLIITSILLFSLLWYFVL